MVSRKLDLGPPSSSASSTMVELVRHVEATIGHDALLRMIEAEHAYLIAMTRLAHEERREAGLSAAQARAVREAGREGVEISDEDMELFQRDGEEVRSA